MNGIAGMHHEKWASLKCFPVFSSKASIVLILRKSSKAIRKLHAPGVFE